MRHVLKSRWARVGQRWVLQSFPQWNWAVLHKDTNDPGWTLRIWKVNGTGHSAGDWKFIATMDDLKAAKAIGRIHASAEITTLQNRRPT